MSKTIGSVVCPSDPVPIIGYRAYCDAWANDDQGLVMASFLGPITVLKSVWAHLVGQRSIELADGTWLWCQDRMLASKDKESIRYMRSIERFPGIEQAHLVLVIESATLQVRQGQKAYVLASDPFGPEMERFFAFWNRVLPLPARESWSEYMWNEALDRHLVRSLGCYGCHGWSVNPEVEPWWEIIRDGIQHGEIQ